MKTLTMALCLTLLGLSTCSTWAQDPETEKSQDDVLLNLHQQHPRLMLTDKRLAELKRLYEKDQNLQELIQNSLSQADRTLNKPPLEYQKRGIRLLHVSRDCLDRTYDLGLAWRWTGEVRYAETLKENLLAVCAFPDWNPSHYLDTAEMSHAVGVGYDWLYDWLDEESREKIRQGLIRHGMEEGVKVYTGKGHWFTRSENNWNQVCNGGMIIGALAIAESDPLYAREFIPAAMKSYPKAMENYSPDGAWIEGPGYWHYATRYVCFAATAMETALGRDFGLTEMPGFSVAGDFPLYTTAPTGLLLNFADSGERAARHNLPCLFYLSRRFERPMYAAEEWEKVHQRGGGPEHVVWYVPEPDRNTVHYDIDRYFKGPVEIVLLRSTWDDRDAAWAGIKAGYNQVPHGHLDLGNFEYETLGVRWARDLGSDDYNMPGYWASRKPGEGRWQYYRLNSQSHNVPLLDGQDQDIFATSKVTKFDSHDDGGLCIVDLTEAYRSFAKRAERGVRLDRKSGTLLVQDEFELKQQCSVAWGMTTDAKIELSMNGRTARLEHKGKCLRAEILSPGDARFTVESAARPKPERPNKGVSRLLARTPKIDGSITLAVQLVPMYGADNENIAQRKLVPLKNWISKS